MVIYFFLGYHAILFSDSSIIPPPPSQPRIQTREQLYPSLTGDGSFHRNSKLISSNGGYSYNYQDRPKSTEPDISNILDELFPVASTNSMLFNAILTSY